MKVFRSERREAICLAWASLGLYVFLSTFFWASGPAPLRTVFYLFILLPVLLVLPWRKFKLNEYGGMYTVSALVFCGYSVLASLWGNAGDFDFFLKQWVFLALWLSGVAWMFYHRDINIQRLQCMMICLGVISATVNLYRFYIAQDNPIALRLEGFGLIENSTIVAQIFGVAALLAYCASLQSQRVKISFLYFGAAVICVLPVILSQSRGAALAFVVVTIAALLLYRPRPAIWIPQLLLVLFALWLVYFYTSFMQVLDNRGFGFSYRDAIWMDVLGRSLDHPWFGLGLEQDSRITVAEVGIFHHAHNSWVDIFYYTGTLGLLLALWHLILVWRSFTLDKNVLPVYIWFAFGCLCLFTNGSGLLTRPDAQWLMYWIPAGILAALSMSRQRCLTK